MTRRRRKTVKRKTKAKGLTTAKKKVVRRALATVKRSLKL